MVKNVNPKIKRVVSKIIELLHNRKICTKDLEVAKNLEISQQTLKKHLKNLAKNINPLFKVEKIDKCYELKQLSKKLKHKFGKVEKKAILKTDLATSHYFQNDVNNFFDSYKFIKESEDGGVEFEISYIKSDEVVPFIQSWLPHLEILEPLNLKKKVLKNISKSLKNEDNFKSLENFNLKARKKIEKYVSVILGTKSNFMGGIGNQIELIGLGKEKLLDFKNLIYELNLGLHYNPDENPKKDRRKYKRDVKTLLEYLETFAIQKLKQLETKNTVTDFESRILELEKTIKLLSSHKIITQGGIVKITPSIQKTSNPQKIVKNSARLKLLQESLLKKETSNKNRLMTIERLEARLMKITNLAQKELLQKQIRTTKANLLNTTEIKREIKLLS